MKHISRPLQEPIFQHVIAVTNRHLTGRALPEQIARVCEHHPQAIILREKDLEETEYEILAKECLAICNHYQVKCILHFYPEVAKRLGCKQIHLPLWKLETLPPNGSIEHTFDSFEEIGVSIHSTEEALRAQQLGATYITAGHIYATDCKKGVPPRGLDFLSEVCNTVSIPVYGIGGIRIDREQIEEVLSRKAAGVCIMSGMMQL